MCSIPGSGFVIVCSEQFKGGNERWDEQAEERVHPTDVSELVGVRQVPAVPGEQEVALVVRREGQMECVPHGIVRHHLMPDVRFYHFGDRRFDSQERERLHEFEALLPGDEFAAFELFNDGDAGDELVSGS